MIFLSYTIFTYHANTYYCDLNKSHQIILFWVHYVDKPSFEDGLMVCLDIVERASYLHHSNRFNITLCFWFKT